MLKTITIWFCLVGCVMADFNATVIRKDDGDTVWVSVERLPAKYKIIAKKIDGKTAVKIRYWLADAPEIAHNSKQTDQPYGQEAKQYFKNLEGLTVHIVIHGLSYDRIVGEVQPFKASVGPGSKIPDPQHTLGLILVKEGLAWVDPRYHPTQEYKDALKNAQDKKLGLWADPNPIPPWDWRKQWHK